MIVAMNTIRIKKGEVDQVISRFKNPEILKQFDGFLGLEVMKKMNGKEEDQLSVCTRWRDEETFNQWLHSQAFKDVHHKTPEERKNSVTLGTEFSLLEVAIAVSK